MKIKPIQPLIFQTKPNKKDKENKKKVLTNNKFDDIINTEIKKERGN